MKPFRSVATLALWTVLSGPMIAQPIGSGSRPSTRAAEPARDANDPKPAPTSVTLFGQEMPARL